VLFFLQKAQFLSAKFALVFRVFHKIRSKLRHTQSAGSRLCDDDGHRQAHVPQTEGPERMRRMFSRPANGRAINYRDITRRNTCCYSHTDADQSKNADQPRPD
jgi:hypothetical protein